MTDALGDGQPRFGLPQRAAKSPRDAHAMLRQTSANASPALHPISRAMESASSPPCVQ